MHVHRRRGTRAIAALAAFGLGLAAHGHAAGAHGIAGNRYFPGTMTFDDPAVADELTLPNYARVKRPSLGEGEVVEDTISGSFMRLLTDDVAIGQLEPARRQRHPRSERVRHDAPDRQGSSVPRRPARDADLDKLQLGHWRAGGQGTRRRHHEHAPAGRLLRPGLRRSAEDAWMAAALRDYRRRRSRASDEPDVHRRATGPRHRTVDADAAVQRRRPALGRRA